MPGHPGASFNLGGAHRSLRLVRHDVRAADASCRNGSVGSEAGLVSAY